MNELRIDSFCRRRVRPVDGSSRFVVVPDVTKDLSAEIVDGGKDASGDNLPLDLGEPDFNLVEPRRVGGCEMNAHLGMMGQEVVDELSLMRREIISNDVDLASQGLGSHHLGKKVDELSAGMTLSRLANDFSASGIKGSVQRKGAVAIILKAMSLGSARRKGQNRIEAVQSLDRTLFVYAKDGGVIRRIQIKADNVGGLLLEVGILTQHIAAQPVRLKAMPSPNARNGHVIGAERRGQPTAAPVGASVLRTTTGPLQNTRLKLYGVRPHFATLMTGHQSRQAACQKTISPALNIRRTTPKHVGYCTHPTPRAQRQNHLGAPGILGPNRSGSDAPAQFSAFGWTNYNLLVLHSLTMTCIVSHINVTLH
jgi:hypothetical protein